MKLQSPQNSLSLEKGFTLLELLVVMAIIIIMVGLAINTLTFDQGRSAVSTAISEIEGAASLARMEARGKSTYVWLCLQQLPATNGSGGGVALATYATKDGSTDTTSNNLMGVTSYKVLKNVRLGDLSMGTPDRLSGEYDKSGVASTNVERLVNSTNRLQPQANRSFDTMIRFNPRGIPAPIGSTNTNSTAFLEVLVYPTHGGAATSEKSSSLLIQYSTGIARKYW